MKACARCGEMIENNKSVCSKCGSKLFDETSNNKSPSKVPAWRKRMADMMKEEMNEPESFWWLSFCDPDKPQGTQFLGAIVVKAHGLTDALTKCNVMLINPGGEVKGVAIPDSEEVRERLKPEVINRLLSMQDMIDLGWEPVSMNQLES